MHIHHLGGSPGADFLGTIMLGQAQGLIHFLMTPAHSNVLIFLLNPAVMLKRQGVRLFTNRRAISCMATCIVTRFVWSIS